MNTAGRVTEYGKCLNTETRNPSNSAKAYLTRGTQHPFRCLVRSKNTETFAIPRVCMVAILCRLCFLMSPFVCHFFLKGGQFYGAGSFSGLCPIRCVIYYTVLYEGSPLVGECLEIGNFLSEDVNHRKCTRVKPFKYVAAFTENLQNCRTASTRQILFCLCTTIV